MKCETKMLGTKNFFLSNKVENSLLCKIFFCKAKEYDQGLL